MIVLGLGSLALFGIYSSSCSWLRKKSNDDEKSKYLADKFAVYVIGIASAVILSQFGIIGMIISMFGILTIFCGTLYSMGIFGSDFGILTKPIMIAFNAIADIGDKVIASSTKVFKKYFCKNKVEESSAFNGGFNTQSA